MTIAENVNHLQVHLSIRYGNTGSPISDTEDEVIGKSFTLTALFLGHRLERTTGTLRACHFLLQVSLIDALNKRPVR